MREIMAELAASGLTPEQSLLVMELTASVAAAAAAFRRPTVAAACPDALRYKSMRDAGLTLAEWATRREAVFERDGKICAYCADEDGPFHIDHRHPVSRGGSWDEGNLCVACAPCNWSKGDRTLEEWGRA